jgi:uncharacterized protein
MKALARLAVIALFAVIYTHAQSSAPAPAPQPAPAQPATAAPTAAQTASNSSAAAAQLPIDPVKAADIAKLLEVSGAAEIGTQMMTDMGKTLRPLLLNSLPPGDYRERLIELFFAKFQSKTDANMLKSLAVPVYDKYFTDDEVKQLTAYYSTPLGKKTLSVMPKVLSELQESGRKWGENIGRDSMLEVLAEHPELKQALEDASKGPSPQ